MTADKFEGQYGKLLKQMDILTCQLNQSYVSLGCSIYINHLEEITKKTAYMNEIVYRLKEVQDALADLDSLRFNYGSV